MVKWVASHLTETIHINLSASKIFPPSTTRPLTKVFYPEFAKTEILSLIWNSTCTNKSIRRMETRRDRPKPEVGKTNRKRLVYTRARSILTHKQNIHQRVLPWMVSGNWEAKKRRMTTATNAIHRPISPLHMFRSHVRAHFQEVSSSQSRTGRREIQRILVSWCGTWQGRAVLPQVAKEWLW